MSDVTIEKLHAQTSVPATCCAIIPARGGSKGIPDKNLQLVAGRALLAHTILAARASRRLHRVFVSTDSARIAALALEYGAEVIDRPKELADDRSTSESALLHGLSMLRDQGYEADILVFLQCTSPFTSAEDIDETIAVLESQGADSATAVTPTHANLWTRSECGFGRAINHDKLVRLRRQDSPPQYLETGAVYVMRVAGFIESQRRFFGNTALYEMPAERAYEIDEPIDLQIAIAVSERFLRHDQLAALPVVVGALVMDFDGVFTDNRVILDETGLEAVRCSRSDGLGIENLRKSNLPMLVISKEENPVTRRRCEKLGLEVIAGVDDKLPVLLHWCQEREVTPESVVYLGNDVNDAECLGAVGCAAVVADAHLSVRASAHLILSKPGGDGAIRELCDLIITRQLEIPQA